MADYPVLDGAGGTIVENEVDPAYVATPYDNSGDYPVLDALGNVIVEGDNIFDPATLFSGGERGWFHVEKPEYWYTDAAGTTPAGYADPIAHTADLSGSGNHLITAVAGERPTGAQSGSYSQAEHDLTDDRRYVGGFSLASETTTWDLVMAYTPSGEDFILLMEYGDNSPIVGVGADGSGFSLAGAGVAVNAVYLDNVLTSVANRGELFTAVQTATRVHVNFTANGTLTWTQPQIGQYNGGGYTVPGPMRADFLREGTMTSEERANLDSFMQTVTG